jgi:hypothetical protein
MFLIAGVQPKTRRIDDTPRRCPICGLPQAYTTRIDYYLSLFFLPVIRVKQGPPFLLCEHCQQPVEDSRPEAEGAASASPDTTCVACRKTFDVSYQYCPYCGQRAK